MKSEFALAFNEVLEEKGLPRDTIIAAIEAAMVSAYRKSIGASAAQDVQVKIDLDRGMVTVFAEKRWSRVKYLTIAEVELSQARLVNPERRLAT